MKTLILGFDSFDPKVFEELAGQNQLSNFQKFVEQGGYSQLQVCSPPQTEVSWPSIATGADPGGHGIFAFGEGPVAQSGGGMSDERPASILAARIGLYLGPLVFLAIVLSPPPVSLSLAGWRTAGVMALMMVWWITEAVPIPVTSLPPLALFPLLDVLDTGAAAAPYANELIFLFKKGNRPHQNNIELGKHGRYRTNVWHYAGTNSFGAERERGAHHAPHSKTRSNARGRDSGCH